MMAVAIVIAAAAVPATGFAAVPRAAASTEGKGGPRVIIDTDLSRWWDDASTIGLANVLHRESTSSWPSGEVTRFPDS
jgi:hypothetical protein